MLYFRAGLWCQLSGMCVICTSVCVCAHDFWYVCHGHNVALIAAIV